MPKTARVFAAALAVLAFSTPVSTTAQASAHTVSATANGAGPVLDSNPSPGNPGGSTSAYPCAGCW